MAFFLFASISDLGRNRNNQQKRPSRPKTPTKFKENEIQRKCGTRISPNGGKWTYLDEKLEMKNDCDRMKRFEGLERGIF